MRQQVLTLVSSWSRLTANPADRSAIAQAATVAN